MELGLNHAKRLNLRARLKAVRMSCPLFDTAQWVRDLEKVSRPCVPAGCMCGQVQSALSCLLQDVACFDPGLCTTARPLQQCQSLVSATCPPKTYWGAHARAGTVRPPAQPLQQQHLFCIAVHAVRG